MRKLNLKKLQLGKRALPAFGVVTALVMGTLFGMHMDKPQPPSITEIKMAVLSSVQPLRSDVRDLGVTVNRLAPKPAEVVVVPVKTEPIKVEVPKKAKAKKADKPTDARGLFDWFKK